MSQTDTKLKTVARELEGLNERQMEKVLWWLSGATSILKTEASKSQKER